ncbi:MAG: hypothetical protein U9P71_02100 [Campylobacterota bacterium]|nr:hypothetical protein [Campylobacterota bacterium]
MIKVFLASLLMLSNLLALQNVQPEVTIKASGDVQALVQKDGSLYVATSNSAVEIYNLKTKALTRRIEIPYLKDFMGDLMPSKIYSVDMLNNKIIFVSEGKKGYRNLWLDDNGKVKKIIDVSQKWFMRKAMYVNDNKVLIALLTNELILYDISTSKVIYKNQVSASSFAEFMLSEDKMSYATTDESGIVRIIDTLSGEVKRVLEGQNVDKVYQLDYKKGVVLTAGQDRRSATYNADGSASYIEFHFLLYSCALSPDAFFSAVAYNEENDILVYETQNKKKRYNLRGQDSTMTQIIFLDKSHIVASSDSQTINFWTLK